MPKSSTSLSRPVVATGIAATVIIAAGAFVLSFSALTDLARMSGIAPGLAWIWPVIIDGLIVASTVAIVALAGAERRRLAYPWALLFGGALVSTGANAVHAILASAGSEGAVPPVVAAIVASMPPIVLLAVTHLCVVLVQSAPAPKAPRAPARRAAQPSAAAPGPDRGTVVQMSARAAAKPLIRVDPPAESSGAEVPERQLAAASV